MAYSVDYKFQQGGPMPPARYYWVVKSDEGKTEFDYGWQEMKNQDTLQGRVLGGGAFLDRGPWEMYIEVEDFIPGQGRARKRISNSIKVAAPAPPAGGAPGAAPGAPAKPPEPPKPVTEADLP